MSFLKDNTKAKVIIGFGTGFGIVVIAIYLTYISFTRLLYSVEVLAQPNIKLVKLQHTLASMASAESSIRAYTLTTEEKYFKTYLSNLDTIHSQIDSLRLMMATSPLELAQVDSMASLLQTKKLSLKQYVALKKEQKRNDYSDKALQQIISAAMPKPASTTIRQHTTTTTVITDIPPVPEAEKQTEAPKEDAKKGIFGGLFSKKAEKQAVEPAPQSPPKVLIPQMNVTREIEIDTNAVGGGKVADLSRIRRILNRVQMEANRDEKELTAKAIALLKEDKMMMDQIRSMMYNLENYEMQRARQRSKLARSEAKHTSLILLLIGVAGLISGVAFILLILRDITRSNHYKSRLILARKDAVQLARAKEAFLANMSHEMRTPLNVILGFTQQLRHTSLQPQQSAHLQAIHGAGQHLLHIVNDVLDLSKIEAGKLNINHGPFRLPQLITEIEQAFALKASEKGIRLVCIKDDEFPDDLIGDQMRLKQVLFNLIDNAIKFTPTGRIEVYFHLKAQRRTRIVASISVTDTGIGIPSERLEHIFGEFNQADNSILRKYGGTGLGLSISKKLVEMQGGTLSVRSTKGEGTTFSMVVPLQKSELAPVEIVSVPLPREQAFSGLRALVIDDDAYSRTLCELILNRWGMEVYLANDGHEAVQLAKRMKFNVVLTDMQLPGMSGKGVARAIRKTDKQVPIMALTANIMGNDKNFFSNTPIETFLLKPFTEEDLYGKLTKLLPTNTIASVTPAALQLPAPAQAVSTAPARYSLAEIQQFTGPDTSTLVSVLDVMLEDQYQNLQQLQDAQQENDWETVAGMAHKMLTAFKHLHAHTVTPALEALEQGLRQEHTNVQQLEALTALVDKEATQILQDIEEALESLRITQPQVVTTA
ncbi:response regulator [Pontibacter sp. 172403-2]|uniref:ATP-binding protein n=1 Tax=Pontibacter rufus TaxID=2791028 RepID=UPI0018AF7A4C|nr:ATP-binding protein [Pontibacter sp. 172403-2]MBF9252952.1 response regulator [Pontibacter sp. 172403-2]